MTTKSTVWYPCARAAHRLTIATPTSHSPLPLYVCTNQIYSRGTNLKFELGAASKLLKDPEQGKACTRLGRIVIRKFNIQP
jgi:hypothetical protein